MAQNWLIDPVTRDYVMKNGAPVETDSLLVPAYHRLKIKQGTWLYAPDDEYGSRFASVKKLVTGANTTVIENLAMLALQPMMDDGRSSRVTVQAVASSRHGLGLKAAIFRARGSVDQFEILSLGI